MPIKEFMHKNMYNIMVVFDDKKAFTVIHGDDSTIVVSYGGGIQVTYDVSQVVCFLVDGVKYVIKDGLVVIASDEVMSDLL